MTSIPRPAAHTPWLSLDSRSLGLFRALLGGHLLIDVTRRIAAVLAELQAELVAMLVLAGLIVAWVAALRYFLGHKTTPGETLWTWLTYVVACHVSSAGAPPADRVLACLLLWSAWLPVGDRWSLDALVRRARPPGESARRPEGPPASPLAILGFAGQLAVILGGLALAAGGEDSNSSAAFGAPPWLLAAAAGAAMIVPWTLLPTVLRGAALAILVAAVGWNLAAHFAEPWAWTQAAAAVACVDGKLCERLADWFARGAEPVTCYFDDDCGVCQAVCRTLGGLDRAGNITFIGNHDTARFLHPVPEGLTDRTIVVFDQRGRMYLETRAVAALLAVLPWPWRIGRWLGVRGLADVKDFAYRAVARNRRAISVWLGLAACGTGLSPAGAAAPETLTAPGSRRSALWPGLLMTAMLWQGYNANLAGRCGVRPLPEPVRLRAALELALFDQPWTELRPASGPVPE